MALTTKENYDNEFIESFLEEIEANFKYCSEQWEAIKNVKITGLWCPISDEQFEILKQKEVREELNRRSKNFIIDDIAFLDTDNRPLFYVTTHEGFSMIHPDVLDVDISWIKSGY